jgi:hypothetical protein
VQVTGSLRAHAATCGSNGSTVTDDALTAANLTLAGCQFAYLYAAAPNVTAVRFLGDAKSSLGDSESSLGDAKSSLGDSESSLGDAKSSLGDAKSSLGDAKSSLGEC